MANNSLPYGRQSISDEDVAAVATALRGDWLTQGPTVAAFEQALCETTGGRHAIAVNSGTAALHLAALALNVAPGSIGITSPITFVASANAIRYAGGEVRFCDVDPHSGLIDVHKLAELVSALQKAGTPPKIIIPVDFSGQPANLPAIAKIASSVHSAVVEDAAHSLGATYSDDGATHGAGCGAHADAAILSFHPVKHITTCEGGAVVTNNAQLAQRIGELRTHGIHRDSARFSRPTDDPMVGPWYHEQADLGFNYRIPDLLCALGISQLQRLPAFVSRRRELVQRYQQAFAAEPLAQEFQPCQQRSNAQSSYHLFVIQLRSKSGETPQDVAARRKDLFEYLRGQNIFAQVHYIPVFWQPYYRQRYGNLDDQFPGAISYYARSLSLPLFPAMADQDVERVASACRSWLDHRSRTSK